MTTERGQQKDGARRPSASSAAKAERAITDRWAAHARDRIGAITTPVPLTLPSGLQVMARRASMRDLIRLKMVPDQLTAAVHDWIAKIDEERPAELVQKEISEDPISAIKRFNDVLRGIWLACVTTPAFTTDETRAFAEEPPFHIDIVDGQDMLYLYRWAQGVDESVESFLREQAEALGSVVDGASLPLPTEPALRDQ